MPMHRTAGIGWHQGSRRHRDEADHRIAGRDRMDARGGVLDAIEDAGVLQEKAPRRAKRNRAY
jgi:hypothetical protein